MSAGKQHRTVIDISDRTDEAAITALCTFGEIVKTSAGEVRPTSDGFDLVVGDRAPRPFNTASGAVEVLRRLTDKGDQP